MVLSVNFFHPLAGRSFDGSGVGSGDYLRHVKPWVLRFNLCDHKSKTKR